MSEDKAFRGCVPSKLFLVSLKIKTCPFLPALSLDRKWIHIPTYKSILCYTLITSTGLVHSVIVICILTANY